MNSLWTGTILADRLFAMHPGVLVRMVTAGPERLAAEWKAIREGAEQRAMAATAQTDGAVAVIPIVGAITNRRSFWSDIFGDSVLQVTAERLRAALASSNVKAVLLDEYMPGGTVDGVPEFADEVFSLRGSKPIASISNTQMSSAGYWIGAQAERVYAMPSAMQGSLGVWTMHQDLSEMLKQVGVAVTLISAGKYKTEGNPFEPLSEEARARLQEMVDQAHDWFLRAVAKGRGIAVADVRKNFGQGRELTAKEAKSVGMIDRIATFDEAVAELARGKGFGGARASVVVPAAAAPDGVIVDERNEHDGRAVVDALETSEVARPEPLIIDAKGKGEEKAEMVEPDDDGECPDGYEKSDDGMCHLMPAAVTPKTDEAKEAEAADAVARDRDWLETV